jgi:hypothetical protein
VYLTIAVVETADAVDEVLSLRAWLVAEDELRGRVQLIEQEPEPDELGSVLHELAVVVGPGGGAVLASVLVAWVRHRTSDVTCKLVRKDGICVEVSAKRLRRADTAAVREVTGELLAWLEADPAGADGSGTSPTSS